MSNLINTKASRKWTGLVGSGGVADSSVTTVPIASATGLTNGAVYYLTIDRVDSSGVKTPTLEELIKGTLSGTNFINCTRGVGGTAQAHAAGKVVEILSVASQWNDLTTGLAVEHAETGVHTSALVTTLKATGAEVTTGTEDAKIVTPKALTDGYVPNGKQIATPANPASGFNKLYFKSDNTLYSLTSAGTESAVGTDWKTISATLTYSSADDPTFVATTSVDLTGVIPVGAKIKLTQTTAKYFIVTAIDASTITLYGGTDYDLANATIDTPYFSTSRCPLGFPMDKAKWSAVTLGGSYLKNSGVADGTYYSSSITLVVPIGCWDLGYSCSPYAQKGSAGSLSVLTTLSIDGSTEYSSEYRTTAFAGDVKIVGGDMFRTKIVTFASKTTVTILIKGHYNPTTLEIQDTASNGRVYIRAVCAYL